MINYIGEVLLLQGLLWLWLRWGLWPSKNWAWIRLGLFVCLLLPIFWPLVYVPLSLPSGVEQSLNLSQMNIFDLGHEHLSWAEDLEERASQPLADMFSWASMLFSLYALVALFFLGRNFWGIFQIAAWRKSAHHLEQGGLKYAVHEEVQSPFSFFQTVFIPKQAIEGKALRMVLLHEYAHIHLKHSWDRLLLSIICPLFWVSPFVWLFRSKMIQVHEFQADGQVLAQAHQITQQASSTSSERKNKSTHFHTSLSVSAEEYQLLLLQFAIQTKTKMLGPQINGCSTKLRIQMMREKKNTFSWMRKTVVGLSMASIALAWACESPQTNIATASIPNDSPLFRTVVSKAAVLEKPSGTPIKNLQMSDLKSGFGMRLHPVSKTKVMHKGLDFGGLMGISILAAGDGIVRKVAFDKDGYGHYVIIDHAGGYSTLYAQLQLASVKEGQSIARGERLGALGSSGMSTGPHLHYEMMKDGKHIDPINHIEFSAFYLPDLSPKPKEGDKDDKC